MEKKINFVAGFIALIILQVIPAFGQSSRYLLETFGTRNGLLSPKIYSLKQSADRQLWIGSELGISVFNGYSFRNYQYSTGNENIGRILAIAQDSVSGMWIGGDKGLFRFYNDSFAKVEFRDRPALAIESLLTDADGNLWVGDLTFLYKIENKQVALLKKKANIPANNCPICRLKRACIRSCKR